MQSSGCFTKARNLVDVLLRRLALFVARDLPHDQAKLFYPSGTAEQWTTTGSTKARIATDLTTARMAIGPIIAQ